MNPNSGFDMPRPVEQARPPEIKIASATVASEKHPDRNEDAFFHSQRRDVTIAGVCDGVGGIAGGGQASTVARERLLARLQQMPAGVRSDEAYPMMQSAMMDADMAVRRLAGSGGEGPATTASVLVICESSTKPGQLEAIPCNVGDSRIYRLSGGVLEQITLDDSSVRYGKTEAGARDLQDKLSRVKSLNDPSLSLEDKIALRNRNVVDQALGTGSRITPRMPALPSEVNAGDKFVRPIEVNAGDKFVLLSDGISDNLTTDEIQGFLTAEDAHDNPQLAIDRMKEASLRRSREPRSDDNFRPKADDMTGIVIDIGGQEQKGYATPAQVVKPAEKISSSELVLPGTKVMVRRSSGEIDGDWEVVGSGIGGNIVVTKEVDGKTLTKQVPTDELQRLNDPVEQKALINHTVTEQELFDALTGLGGLQGSQEFYNSIELIAQVKKVMAGEEPLGSLTRTGNLRTRVGELMTLRQNRGKL